MQTELRIHRLVTGILVVLLVLFLCFVLSLYPGFAHQRFEVIASLAIVIATASVFVMVEIVERGTLGLLWSSYWESDCVCSFETPSLFKT